MELWIKHLPGWDPIEVADVLGGEVIHATHQFIKYFVKDRLPWHRRSELCRAILFRVRMYIP